jgi:hypothetical protein
MNRLNILLLIFLSANFALADPAVFFVANEGQWPGDFAFRYEGGGGAWFVTRTGLTIDLKQYSSPVRSARLDAFLSPANTRAYLKNIVVVF